MASDYNPILSRYVESDPLGLSNGDYTTYQYAGGNPLTRNDPFGLCKIQVGYSLLSPVDPNSGFPYAKLAYHAFVVVTDPTGMVESDGRSQHVFHGFPENYPIPSGSLLAVYSIPDPDNNAEDYPLDTVRDDGCPCTTTSDILVQGAFNINRANIPYKLTTGPNSNTAAHYGLTTLGITTYTPSRNVPGDGTLPCPYISRNI